MRKYPILFLLILFISGQAQAFVPDFYRWYNALDSSGITDIKETAGMRRAMGIADNSPIVDLWQAKIYLTMGKYDSSLVFAKKVLNAKGATLLFPTCLAISEVYIYQAKFDSASHYSFEMLRLADKAKDKNLIAFSYFQLAKLYYYMEVGGKYERKQTLYYFQLCNNQNSSWPELNALKDQLLGAVYQAQNRFDTAEFYIKRSIEFRKKNRTEYRLAKLYNLLAANYNRQGDYDTALSYFQEALAIAERFKQQPTLILVYGNIGENYDKMKKYKTALSYYIKALPICDSVNSNEQTIWLYSHIARSYDTLKKFELSAYYYKEITKLKNKVFAEQVSANVAKSKIEYETEKKENENKLLKAQNELQIVKQKQLQQFYSSLGIAAFFFILLLIVGFWLFYRWSAWKSKQAYRQQKMNALIEGEQQERSRIARELHDNIGQLLAALRMQISVIGYQVEDKTISKKALELTDQTLNEVRSLSHALLPEELAGVPMESAFLAIIDRIPQSENLQIHFSIAGNPNISPGKQVQLLRIFQELISNILKHAEASEINITLQQLEGKIILKIDENGKGFDTNKIHEQKGLGWKNIEAKVQYLKGAWTLESKLGKGSNFYLEFPIDK